MAADVAKFLMKKFLIGFDEAVENELSLHPLLPRFEAIKLVVEEIGNYLSSSSNTLVLHSPLYLLNNVLAQCRIFEYQYNEPDKSSARFNFLTRFYFNQWMKYRLSTVKRKLDAFVIEYKQNSSSQLPILAPQSYPSASAKTSTSASTSASTSTSTFIDESEIVGFDKQAEEIEDLLLGSRSDTLTAIAVVGMGGVGKSTLVRKVLSTTRIQDEFFPRIQVCLSAVSSNEVDIASKILRYALMELNFNDLNQNLGSIELLEILKSQLFDKRYLIVLDDVRHKNKWYDNLDSATPDQGDIFEEHLLHGLPKGSGSAVIVTSRLEDVARSIVGGKNLFRLKPCLSPRNCLKILEKHINGNHMNTDKYNIFLKIKYEVVDQCHGLPLAAEKMARFISELNPTSDAWRAVEKRFDQLTANFNGILHRSLFCKCIDKMEWQDFEGELFDSLARRRNIHGDYIRKDQLKELWEQISLCGFDTMLYIFLEKFNIDGDGSVTQDEVEQVISKSAAANKLTSIQKRAKEFAALIMEELDPYNLGYIMVDNVAMLLLQSPINSTRGVNRSLSRTLNQKFKPTNETNPYQSTIHLTRGDNRELRRLLSYRREATHKTNPYQSTICSTRGDNSKLSRMLSQKLKPTHETNPLSMWYQSTKYFVLDNWQRVWVIALWIGTISALFSYKYAQYRNRAAYEVMGVCVCVAKGAAETLKLNMALILLLVCRNTITWLRNKTKLGYVVPFDDSPNFHKVIAIGIAMGVGVHAIAHLTCSFPRILRASSNEYGTIKRFFGEVQPTSYWHFLKSVEGVTGIIMVLLMAIAYTLAAPCFRRGSLNLPKPLKNLNGFNVFWFSHHLFAIVYALLIFHGIYTYLAPEWYQKTTWMYLGVPLTLYCSERLTRALGSSTKAVTMLKVAVYPGNVLALHMSKPQEFRYESGQYMYVSCAAVSPFEWHPFSINSSPGDDYLCVHIRILGDWTRQLRAVLSEACQTPLNLNGGLLRANLQGENNPDFPRVLIDGPYGAPTQEYKKYEVVLLVGLGIGATPMISIVKDIVNNVNTMDEKENALESGSASANSIPTTKRKTGDFKTRRAYFYWVTREQGSFDWFKGLMNEVADMDLKGVIEMHNYCTSVYEEGEEGDTRSALIDMLQFINHAKNGVDVEPGTRVKSHFAKPNWHNVYKRVTINHFDSRVGVFYCGSPALTKELKQLALGFSHKSSTKFDFHKENF